ncbi:MAG: GTP-sensing pleiotropic transcriptional regulator CodY [Synergistaceae bacterium]|nr:GTP-sensing pleiotropic transcriptional regulator CodY [Synergistaceae bacterium]
MGKKIQSESVDDVSAVCEVSMSEVVRESGVLEELLEKIRQTGRAFQHRKNGEILDYGKLARVLSETLDSNVYMLNKEGKVLGHAWVPGYSSRTFSDMIKESAVLPAPLTERANYCSESQIDDEDACLFDKDANKKHPNQHLMYVPIYASTERLGTVVLVRSNNLFKIRDILMAEYLGTLVGIEMLHDTNRSIEKRSRDYSSVQMAMRALSYSEVESIKHLMEDLDGLEGIAIASKVADRVGVTRSVIVNALRKLESAGLIESRSLGMKGTYIKVLSPLFAKELGEPTAGRIAY